MYTLLIKIPFSSSSPSSLLANSLFGLFGGDFGLFEYKRLISTRAKSHDNNKKTKKLTIHIDFLVETTPMTHAMKNNCFPVGLL
jgi:hypothetical protein